MSAWPRWRGLSRRAFLGGAAATVTLPLLPSLLPRTAAADATVPTRLLFWFCPNGMHMPAFTPATTGTGWELPPILAGLAPVRDHVNVLTGLANLNAIDQPTGDHPRGTASFLSCARVEYGRVAAGPSADQLFATRTAGATPFPSLQIKLADNSSTCDPGYSCVYNDTISWASATTPLPGLTNPQVIFDRLFAGLLPGPSEADRARRAAVHSSILDHVVGEATALQGRLSGDDQRRLEEYLTAVRELETRLQRTPGRACVAPGRPADRLDIEATMDALIELMVIALQCDLTRTITFMQGNGGSPREYSHIGLSVQHHWASHHMGDPAMHDLLTQIGAWEVGQYARLLQRLQAVPEGAGTLLDASMVLLGSEISDGNEHTHRDLPVLLGGGACAGLSGGRHLVYDGAPMADLLLTLLQAAGVAETTFGVDGTEALAGLIA